MPEQKKRGAFIVLEGLDRSGKSTQAALLADRLKQEGVDVKLMKFPGQHQSPSILTTFHCNTLSEQTARHRSAR